MSILIEGAAKLIIAASVGVAATVAGVVATKKIDEKKTQEEKKKSFEYGLKVGADMSTEQFHRDYLYPWLSQVALAYYVARVDGSVSKKEQRIIEEKTEYLLNNPSLPDKFKTELLTIINDKDISFEIVQKYLDKSNIEKITDSVEELTELARATRGISKEEQNALDQIHQYFENRIKMDEIENDDKSYLKSVAEITADSEKYMVELVAQETIQKVAEEYTLKMRLLDAVFSHKTKLEKKEIALLMIATGLQCLRIYLANKLTEVEPAGAQNKKEKGLHGFQDKVFSAFKSTKENPDIARPYYAPLNDIITISSVPYDITRYDGEALGLFQGGNHRFATLGHDPIIGLVVGTVNIMTNTITTINPVPSTHHVRLEVGRCAIGNNASLVVALTKSIERTTEDITPLVAAFMKQLIHIATDLYTPKGIQLPGANLVLSSESTEALTNFISFGDIAKIGASAGVTALIDKIIALLYGCFLLDSKEDLNDPLQQVKLRKIILFSNSIATSSNIIQVAITKRYEQLDIGGFAVLLSHVFRDINFIYDVKREFISRGLGEI